MGLPHNVFYVRLSSRDSRAMENLHRTIDAGVPISAVRDLLPVNLLANLTQYHPSLVFSWGSIPTPANQRIWSKMRSGDYFFVLVDNTLSYIIRVITRFVRKNCKMHTME